VSMVDQILFPEGGWQINQQGEVTLNKIVPTLQSLQNQRIVVQGFTDNVPIGPELRSRFPSNWELSTARATDVVRYLVAQGVNPNMLSAAGLWRLPAGGVERHGAGAGQEPTGGHRHHGGGQLAPQCLLWVHTQTAPGSIAIDWPGSVACPLICVRCYGRAACNCQRLAACRTQRGRSPSAGKQWGLWVRKCAVLGKHRLPREDMNLYCSVMASCGTASSGIAEIRSARAYSCRPG
jgi:OmpA family